MNAKQEAQRLYDRFYNETLSHLSDHNTKEDARSSALICVEEMMEECSNWTGGDNTGWDTKRFDYFESVKQELKKL
jgi:hypothetical protein